MIFASPIPPRRRRWARAAVAAVVLLSTGTSAADATPTVAHALIVGSGSSWASNALNQWIADVHTTGLQVVYTASGSTAGRQDFANGVDDFAVSDIPYQGADPVSGTTDTAGGRAYAAVPLVAGGVSFPYQLHIGGQLVRNLRLSPATLAAIFTGTLTYWDDPRVAADNGHRLALPHIPVIPVVHAEGSAVSLQFGSYLAARFPTQWQALAHNGAPSPYWPQLADAATENGSDSVTNLVASAAGDGAIGMDEYAYALGKNLPVAKVENAAGYYVLPTAYNVAVALTAAQPYSDPSTSTSGFADFTGVWTNSDRRAYPLSSYSAALIPTASDDPRMTTPKRQTIAEYLAYARCQGQRAMAPLGYAPLPLGLTAFGDTQVAALQQVDAGVDLTGLDAAHCTGTPTFAPGASPGSPPVDTLLTTAPYPLACDAASAPLPCGDAPDPSALTVPASAVLTYREARTLTTRLTGGHPLAVLAGRAITLWQRPAGSTTWHRLAAGRTSASGTWSVLTRPAVTTTYQFRYAGDGTHAAAVRGTLTYVRFAVSLHHAVSTIRSGATETFWGVVSPARTGEHVVLDELRSGRPVALATTTTTLQRLPDGSLRVGYRIGLVLRARGHRTFRTHAYSDGRDASGNSPSVIVSVQ